jgi:hypothetical protein
MGGHIGNRFCYQNITLGNGLLVTSHTFDNNTPRQQGKSSTLENIVQLVNFEPYSMEILRKVPKEMPNSATYIRVSHGFVLYFMCCRMCPRDDGNGDDRGARRELMPLLVYLFRKNDCRDYYCDSRLL